MLIGNGVCAKVCTDADGWHTYSYRYTGKPTSVMLKLLDYRYSGETGSSIVQVPMKSNALVIVDFYVPSLW